MKWIEERTYMECPNCHDIWHYEKNQTERFKFCPTCGNKVVEKQAITNGTKTTSKTAHWVYRIYGEFHEQGNWHCSHCGHQFNYGNGHAKYCPECGYEMSEPSTEEAIRDKDYDWIIKR